MADLNQLLSEITQKIETIHIILGGRSKSKSKTQIVSYRQTTNNLFQNCPFNKKVSTSSPPEKSENNWFSNAFLYNEVTIPEHLKLNNKSINTVFMNNQHILGQLFRAGEYKTINEMNVGNFNLLTFKDFTYLYKNTPGNITVGNITEDVINLHQICDPHSTFQVASQLNCLEMVRPIIIPEEGITIYRTDDSQGPKCVMQTPAAIAYRNYLYPYAGGYGQEHNRQINMADDLLQYLCSKNESINNEYLYKNGYLFITKSGLILINNILQDNNNYSEAQSKLKIGNHTGISLCNKKNKLVNHVLCSGLPIGYHTSHYINLNNIPEKFIHNPIDYPSWKLLSKLFLDTYYINTLLIACENNIINNSPSAPCYLTYVGGGYFEMNKSLINRAKIDACDFIKQKGLHLNVIIVNKP